MNAQEYTTLAQATAAASLRESLEVKQKVLNSMLPDIAAAGALLLNCLRQGHTVFFCGNGGSAADAQHLAAELVGRFERDNCLPAAALTTDSSVLTALGNDFGYDQVFARQVKALVRPGDVLVAISTSGNSRCINLAAEAATAKGAAVLGLSGRDGGALKALCSACLIVPSQRTARIQECHITIGHILCELIEAGIHGPKNQ